MSCFNSIESILSSLKKKCEYNLETSVCKNQVGVEWSVEARLKGYFILPSVALQTSGHKYLFFSEK